MRGGDIVWHSEVKSEKAEMEHIITTATQIPFVKGTYGVVKILEKNPGDTWRITRANSNYNDLDVSQLILKISAIGSPLYFVKFDGKNDCEIDYILEEDAEREEGNQRIARVESIKRFGVSICPAILHGELYTYDEFKALNLFETHAVTVNGKSLPDPTHVKLLLMECCTSTKGVAGTIYAIYTINPVRTRYLKAIARRILFMLAKCAKMRHFDHHLGNFALFGDCVQIIDFGKAEIHDYSRCEPNIDEIFQFDINRVNDKQEKEMLLGLLYGDWFDPTNKEYPIKHFTERYFYPYDHADNTSVRVNDTARLIKKYKVSKNIEREISEEEFAEHILPLLMKEKEEHDFFFDLYRWVRQDEDGNVPSVASEESVIQLLRNASPAPVKFATLTTTDSPHVKSPAKGGARSRKKKSYGYPKKASTSRRSRTSTRIFMRAKRVRERVSCGKW